MKENKYISRREHQLLASVALLALIFVIAVFVWQIITQYNFSIYNEQISKSYQANYSRPGGFPANGSSWLFPGFHLLTLFVFIAILRARKFVVSLLLGGFYLILNFYGFFLRIEPGISDSPQTYLDFIKRLCDITELYDWIALSFALIILIWQISILFHVFQFSRNGIKLS